MDQRERADRIEPALAAEPIENTEASEPADATDRIDPAEPIDRIEPAEPTDRIEPLDPMLRMEPDDPSERDEPGEFRIATFWQAGGSTSRSAHLVSAPERTIRGAADAVVHAQRWRCINIRPGRPDCSAMVGTSNGAESSLQSRADPPLGMWWARSIRLDATAHKERSGGLLRLSGLLGLGGSHQDRWGEDGSR